MVRRKCNNWDSAADVLRVEHRQSALCHRERPKRQYAKHDNDYWMTEKRESCRKRKQDSVSNVVVQVEPEPEKQTNKKNKKPRKQKKKNNNSKTKRKWTFNCIIVNRNMIACTLLCTISIWCLGFCDINKRIRILGTKYSKQTTMSKYM